MASAPEQRPVGGRSARRYSGRVTALIILAIVAVFVLLNVLAERTVPAPERRVPAPSVTTRPSPP